MKNSSGFFSKHTLFWAVIVLAFSFSIAVMAENENESETVSKPKELIEALEDNNIKIIVFKNSITTKVNLTVPIDKEINLNGNTWQITDDKKITVSLRGYVYGGTIKVPQKATLLAYVVPNVNMVVKGVMRVNKTYSIDRLSGTVSSIKYENDKKKDTDSGVNGAQIESGSVSLMVKTDSNGNSKKVSYIVVDGVTYKLDTGRYIARYTINFKSNVPDIKIEPKVYTLKDLPFVIDPLPDDGFLGWTGETLNGTVQTIEVTKDNAANLVFTALFDENVVKKAGSEAERNGYKDHYSGFSGRGGKGFDFSIVGSDGVELETVEGEEAEELAAEGETSAEGRPDEAEMSTGNPGQPNRPKRVSVASSRTKTNFETGSAPKTEDVGVTVEQDPAEKIRLFAIGGGVILVAVALIILLNRSKRKNSRF